MAEGSFAEGLVGIVLDGRYRLDALLGEGGMGAVFRAQHLPTDRRVAVKLLKPHLTGDDTALERFAREARSTMRVDSPHAVKVLDFGITPQRDYYMALEYVDGRTVQREIEIDGPFAPVRVIHIARQALHALGAAHAQGLVHRDIKPENIILTSVDGDNDFAKLLDFGVAKLMEGAARSDRSALALTQKGMVFGTCEFMSPEQACGQTVDARSDLYSLAATMFGMLTGCGMYQANTPLEWLMAHARQPPPHLADGNPELEKYADLDALLQRCFAKHREQRPQTAAEMSDLLGQIERRLTGKDTGPIATSATIVPGTLVAPRAPTTAPARPTALGAPSSVYVEALPSDTLDPIEPPKRRGLWLAIGALAVVGMIIATIIVATRKRDASVSASVSVSGSGSGGGSAAGSGTGSASGSGSLTLTPTPTPTPDAGVAVVPADAAPPPVAHPIEAPKTNGDVLHHLSLAEQAKSAGNRLRQIAEADMVLRSDPKNLRAKILIADGLIATGSTDKGCQYLHGLGKNPTAHSLMTSAGCPSD